MTQFFFQQFFFYVSIALTLIVPGYLMLHFFVSKRSLSVLEKSILSVPLSFAITTFTLLSAAYANVPINRLSVIILMVSTVIMIATSGHVLKQRSQDKGKKNESSQISRKHTIIIALIFSLLCLTKGTYLVNTIFPNSTDLGHHMYWVQRIVTTGEIVPYTKVIVQPNNPESAASSPANFIGSQKIPDFIIGEHIIFAAIALISSISVISAMPSLVLFFIHIISIASLFILSLRLFKPLPYGRNIALLVLLIIGALYAISGAQAKFVSGGVVGNILGNMLIVSALYFFVRSFMEKNRSFFILGILLTTTLLYTHHLSMFILGYVLMAWLAVFCIVNIREISSHLKLWTHLFKGWTLVVLAAIVAYILVIHIPSYLDPETISGSLGSPSKSTRVGIPLWQLIESSGMIRFFLGMCGLAVFSVIFFQTKTSPNVAKLLKLHQPRETFLHPYTYALVIAWTFVILIMTLEPGALKVNILSTRIATYIIFPLSITAGFFLAWLLNYLRSKPSNLPSVFTTLSCTFLLSILILDGLNDNSTSLKAAAKDEQVVQTFHNALYLKNHAPQGSWSLKDHNYIEADSWMKVFMATGDSDYSNPLSRGFFARYESKPKREHCTREMISKPSSPLATNCFNNLNIALITVNTEQDAGQFTQNNDFIKVYQNNEISTFYRK